MKANILKKDMRNRYEFITAIARDAGKRVLEAREKHLEISIKDNNPGNLVTNVDLEISNFISSQIRGSFPGEAIYSEEATYEDISSGSFWAIDPIDGTANFVRNIPHFSIVVAYVERGAPIVGAIYNPVTKELFSFEKGKGAFLNHKSISVSAITDLTKSTVFLSTGLKPEHRAAGADIYRFLLEKGNKVRSMSSSALDICFVAAGRIEACIYVSLTAIDIIASVGILREAGGITESKSGPLADTSRIPQMLLAANNHKILETIRAGV